MTISPENQAPDQKTNDKEYNFRVLEQKLQNERSARIEAERQKQELELRYQSKPIDDEEEDHEPYVDHKKLKKTLNQFGEQNKKQTQSEINSAVQQALREERKNNWLKTNPDFYNVLKNAEKFADSNPELAETILEMPDTFERQQLVYKNIKALGLHQEKQKESSIQEKVDANRRGAFYQPSGVGSAPYSSVGDYSASGQKQAYDKMQELKKNLRI